MLDSKMTYQDFIQLINNIQESENTFVLQVVALESFHLLAEKLALQYTFASTLNKKKDPDSLHFIVDDCKCTTLPSNLKIIFYSTNIYTHYPKILLENERNKITTNKIPLKTQHGEICCTLNDNERLLLFLISNNDKKFTFLDLKDEASKIDESFDNATFCFKIVNSLEIKGLVCKKGTKYKTRASNFSLQKLLSTVK